MTWATGGVTFKRDESRAPVKLPAGIYEFARLTLIVASGTQSPKTHPAERWSGLVGIDSFWAEIEKHKRFWKWDTI
jgi:hypothetical protein